MSDDLVLVWVDRETLEEHEANGECPVSSACCGCHLDFVTRAHLTGTLDAARDVVTDYADKCCTDLANCSCSMARLARLTPTDGA